MHSIFNNFGKLLIINVVIDMIYIVLCMHNTLNRFRACRITQGLQLNLLLR